MVFFTCRSGTVGGFFTFLSSEIVIRLFRSQQEQLSFFLLIILFNHSQQPKYIRFWVFLFYYCWVWRNRGHLYTQSHQFPVDFVQLLFFFQKAQIHFIVFNLIARLFHLVVGLLRFLRSFQFFLLFTFALAISTLFCLLCLLFLCCFSLSPFLVAFSCSYFIVFFVSASIQTFAIWSLQVLLRLFGFSRFASSSFFQPCHFFLLSLICFPLLLDFLGHNEIPWVHFTRLCQHLFFLLFLYLFPQLSFPQQLSHLCQRTRRPSCSF
mmetsp:Transcript_15998/g.22502  ORF Transcript_15998/g.22502 Transcript_15998/m.22502 type:complete len:265 (-) Transcript_15998:338-1132(-)